MYSEVVVSLTIAKCYPLVTNWNSKQYDITASAIALAACTNILVYTAVQSICIVIVNNLIQNKLWCIESALWVRREHTNKTSRDS